MLVEWIDKSKGYNKNILISEIRKSGLNPLSLGIHSVISTALKFDNEIDSNQAEKLVLVYCSPFIKMGLRWNHEQSQLAFMTSYI